MECEFPTVNSTSDEIRDIFADTKTIAILGLSPDPSKASHRVAKYLKEQGYRTALFGKWHLSQHKTPPESLPFNPDKQGFDESFVTYKPSGNMNSIGLSKFLNAG